MNERNYLAGRSPYTKAHIIKYSDGDVSLEKNIPVVITSDIDKVHTLMEGETLQSIAYRYFGDSGYWYQIAEANNIINPLSDSELPIGKRLIIPIYGTIE